MSALEERHRLNLSSAREGRIRDHLFNGLDSGNGLLGERKAESYRAQEFSVNIDGATAHSLHDASLFEWTAAEFGEDNDLLWSEVFKDTEDLDLELFDAITVKYGTAGTP